MTNNKISKMWEELASTNVPGLIKKSYSPYFSNCIYCILDNSTGNRGVAVSYNNDISINLSQLARLRDIQIYITDDTSLMPNKLLVVLLTNKQYIEIFSILCEDLIMSVFEIQESSRIIKTILNQLGKWRALFDNIARGGMQPHEQQGLYGELYFLRKLLNVFVDKTEVIKIWIGPDKSLRDFQYQKCAIEVKTTSSSNHQKLTISSERQLDETLLASLFLFHLSVEVSNKNGETLNEIIKDVNTMLSDDIFASNMFNAKLMEAGYFILDSELYNNRTYKPRRENSYRIINDFPRIKESELRNGIGDVNYTIIIDMCVNYLIPENEIYKTLKLCKK